MNSSEVSLIPAHPFIQRFVFSIIQNIRAKNFDYDERVVVHADLVPKFSENVMKASMVDKHVLAEKKVDVRTKRVDVKKMAASRVVVPIEKVKKTVISPKSVVMPAQIAPVVVGKGEAVVIGEDYGKIGPLLGDPSVSTIECEGTGRSIMVIRAGQRQRTRIVLSEGEIRGTLDRVADEAHVPLLEGVFRASVSGFSINAVISEMIGSKFIIKKTTAYALLE